MSAESRAHESNKAVVRRFLEDCMNSGDLSMLSELFDPDFVWHGSGGAGEARGVDEFRRLLEPFLTAFPDLNTKVDDLVAEGDRVAARFACEGTHRAEVMGVPPTERRVRWIGINVYEVRGGKIVEEWSCEDGLGLLIGLGAERVPA